MMNDPIIDEIRKYRDEHAKKFNYDLKLICADLRKKQADRKANVVDLSSTESPECSGQSRRISLRLRIVERRTSWRVPREMATVGRTNRASLRRFKPRRNDMRPGMSLPGIS